MECSNDVIGMLNDGLLKLSFRLDEHQERVTELAESYEDRKPDLADLCVIRMSEIFRQHRVLTLDREDFSVYRRNRSERIPFNSPER
jgi:hypothetical protein